MKISDLFSFDWKSSRLVVMSKIRFHSHLWKRPFCVFRTFVVPSKILKSQSNSLLLQKKNIIISIPCCKSFFYPSVRPFSGVFLRRIFEGSCISYPCKIPFENVKCKFWEMHSMWVKKFKFSSCHWISNSEKSSDTMQTGCSTRACFRWEQKRTCMIFHLISSKHKNIPRLVKFLIKSVTDWLWKLANLSSYFCQSKCTDEIFCCIFQWIKFLICPETTWLRKGKWQPCLRLL